MLQLEQDELATWDAFAVATLQSLITSKPLGAQDAATVAAGFADGMILERRKRIPEDPEPAGFFSN